MSGVHQQVGHGGTDSPQHHSRHHPPPVSYPYPSTPSNMNMRGPGPMPGAYPGVPGGAPFNSVPPNQFFNESASPMRMSSIGMGGMGGIGGMGGMGMMDHGHGLGGHAMGGGMGMGGGGMPAMSTNLSPDIRRRVTRGMTDEGFPMH